MELRRSVPPALPLVITPVPRGVLRGRATQMVAGVARLCKALAADIRLPAESWVPLVIPPQAIAPQAITPEGRIIPLVITPEVCEPAPRRRRRRRQRRRLAPIVSGVITSGPVRGVAAVVGGVVTSGVG